MMNFYQNRLIIVRSYDWQVKRELIKFQYHLVYIMSEIFEIFQGKQMTKWQFILTNNHNTIHLQLHKIGSQSLDGFTVKLYIFSDDPISSPFANAINIKKTFVNEMKGEWFFLQKYDYLCSIFTLKIMITLEEEPFKIYDSPKDIELMNQNEELMNTISDHNFTFICSDGIRISTNRAYLCYNSPVMKTMLEAPMAESKECTAKLEDIDSKTMREVIRYMYSKRVENLETLAPKLMYCAEKYEINGLKAICVNSMIQNVCVDNIFEYLVLSDRYQENQLFRRCILVITAFYDALRDQPEWKTLDPKLVDMIEYFVENREKQLCFSLKMSRYERIRHLPSGYKEFE